MALPVDAPLNEMHHFVYASGFSSAGSVNVPVLSSGYLSRAALTYLTNMTAGPATLTFKKGSTTIGTITLDADSIGAVKAGDFEKDADGNYFEVGDTIGVSWGAELTGSSELYLHVVMRQA